MTSDHRRPVPHHVGQGFRLVWPDDWRALMRTRANVLMTGPAEALEAFVNAARADLQTPIRSTASGPALSLESARTLILRDVHQLDEAGQRRLLAWLNEPHNTDTQIVSLTPIPLIPLVEAKRFDRELYYRLNTIHLEAALPN
jgi:transcriptional regulator of acetoin/glycerol metabolism